MKEHDETGIVFKISARAAGKIAAIKAEIEREGRKPVIVVCIRCHAWCWPEQVSKDNLCPRCKEKEKEEGEAQ